MSDAPKCRHRWDENYVCSSCGEVQQMSAPMWAACLKMASGPRGVWLALWSFADRNTEQPDPIWAGNAAIRRRSGGISESALRDQLANLRKAGWIRYVDEPAEGHRREIELAWISRFDVQEECDENATAGNPVGNRRKSGAGNQAVTRRKSGGHPPEIRRSPAGNQAPYQPLPVKTDHDQPGASVDAVGPAVDSDCETAHDSHAQGPERDLFGNPIETNDEREARLIGEWWARFGAMRAASISKWRPGTKHRPPTLTDERIVSFKARLREQRGRTLDEQLAVASHVLAVIEDWVDRDKGQMVPRKGARDYDSLDRWEPDYWLRPSNFTKLADRPLKPPPEQPKTNDKWWLKQDELTATDRHR